jgi:hypothetical protein
VEDVVALDKCTRLPVLSVEKRTWFLSNPEETDPFFVQSTLDNSVMEEPL